MIANRRFELEHNERCFQGLLETETESAVCLVSGT